MYVYGVTRAEGAKGPVYIYIATGVTVSAANSTMYDQHIGSLTTESVIPCCADDEGCCVYRQCCIYIYIQDPHIAYTYYTAEEHLTLLEAGVSSLIAT